MTSSVHIRQPGLAEHWRQPTLGFLGLAVIVAVLEALPRFGIVDRRFLPPCTAMAAAQLTWLIAELLSYSPRECGHERPVELTR